MHEFRGSLAFIDNHLAKSVKFLLDRTFSARQNVLALLWNACRLDCRFQFFLSHLLVFGVECRHKVAALSLCFCLWLEVMHVEAQDFSLKGCQLVGLFLAFINMVIIIKDVSLDSISGEHQ